MKLWWLSYADATGNRGVAVVEANSFLAAAARAKQQGFSPGGQVVGYELAPTLLDKLPPEEMAAILTLPRHVCLSGADLVRHAVSVVDMKGTSMGKARE